MEEVQEQLEVVQEKMESVQEFVLEQLTNFKQELKTLTTEAKKNRTSIKEIKESLNLSMVSDDSRIQAIEEKVETNIKSITDLKQKINVNSSSSESSEDSDREEVSLTLAIPGPSTSTPEPPRKMARFEPLEEECKIPDTVEEVTSDELRSQLIQIKNNIKFAKDKEKLTFGQLVYVHNYIERAQDRITGRSEQVLRLIREGEVDKIWPRNWKPTGVKSDFFTYLQDKLKNIAKRKRINSNKDKLADEMMSYYVNV